MDAQALGSWLASTAPAAVLTGAGMSTDSGIPDYRGSGVDRRRTPPVTYRELLRSEHARRRYWARSHIGYRHIATARPNAAHLAVTDLQRAGLVGPVVTQNVDGLHDRAGTSRLLNLHGRLDRVVCVGCGDLTSRVSLGLRLAALNPDFEARASALAPDGDADLTDAQVEGFRIAGCRVCGGLLKPDVVFFGESMPRDRRDAASAAVSATPGLLVLGSSLAVMSGYRLVLQAAREGRRIAILTRGPSRGDHLADLRLDAGLGEVLPAAVALGGTAALAR